jgi:hypothetical protein
MRDIVKEGINVVDLLDNEKLYNTETLHDDGRTYMWMLARFQRAHEESKTKSTRVRDAWSNKRARARIHKMTKWCPAWLKLSKDRKCYEIIDANAETVRWIFNEAAEGRGIDAITRRLNEKNKPHFGTSKGWHTSYVYKILRNKAVLGVYEPTTVNGKLATEQDLIEHAIPDYYPPIVTEELFYRVQSGLTERRNNGAGRKGPNYTNLFSGLKLTCAYCRGAVRFENKGSGPKGGQYFVCEGARRGRECSARRWRYQHFEDAFLSFVHHEIDFSSLAGAPETERRHVLDRQIEGCRGRIADLEQQLTKRINLIDEVKDPTPIVKMVDAIGDQIKQVNDELAKASVERDALNATLQAQVQAPGHLKELIEILSSKDTDLYRVRSQLATTIRHLISEVILAPLHEGDQVDSIEWGKDDVEKVEAVILLERVFGLRDNNATGYYVVRFKNGKFRIDVPPDNPLETPLDQSETTAMVFIHADGSVEVLEKDAPVPTDDAMVKAIGFVTSNIRTGTVEIKSRL